MSEGIRFRDVNVKIGIERVVIVREEQVSRSGMGHTIGTFRSCLWKERIICAHRYIYIMKAICRKARPEKTQTLIGYLDRSVNRGCYKISSDSRNDEAKTYQGIPVTLFHTLSKGPILGL